MFTRVWRNLSVGEGSVKYTGHVSGVIGDIIGEKMILDAKVNCE